MWIYPPNTYQTILQLNEMHPADIHFLQKSHLHIVVLCQNGKSQCEHAINDFSH